MAVYVDEIRKHPNAPWQLQDGSCHMTADTLPELHEMGERLGVRSYFQHAASVPHYDLGIKKRAMALRLGAVFKPAREQAKERIAARRMLNNDFDSGENHANHTM